MVEAGGLGLQGQPELPKSYLQKKGKAMKGQDLEDGSGLNIHGLAEIHWEALSPKKEKRNRSSNIFMSKLSKQTVHKRRNKLGQANI